MEIKELNGYWVSDTGEVFRQMVGGIANGNRKVMCLTNNGKHYYSYVHRMVWEAFNGPIPEDKEVHHIDGDFLNNNLSNLQLLSPSVHRRTHCNYTNEEVIAILDARFKYKQKISDIEKQFNIGRSNIKNIIYGHNYKDIYKSYFQ